MVGACRQSETTIMLVEDEAIVARDLSQRLSALGYSVVGIAANGADALSLASRTQPALIFMDITIQGPIDGIETAQRLSATMDVPIIFLTAHTDTGTILRAKRACPYGYLIKPLEERDLLTTIEMAMSRHGHDRSARLIEQAVAGAGFGMLMVSASGPAYPITMANSAFERMSGYSPGEAVGRSPWFLEGLTGPAEHSRLRQALHAGRECQVLSEVHRKDGTHFPGNFLLSPVRDNVGETTHFLVCLPPAPAE